MCHLLPLRGVIQLPRGALRMKMETNLGAHLPLANWHPCHSNTGDGKNEMPLIYEICHTYMRHQPTYEFTIGTVVRHRYLYTFAHFLPHRYCFYTYILPIRDGWCYDCGGRVHSLLPSEMYTAHQKYIIAYICRHGVVTSLLIRYECPGPTWQKLKMHLHKSLALVDVIYVHTKLRMHLHKDWPAMATDR